MMQINGQGKAEDGKAEENHQPRQEPRGGVRFEEAVIDVSNKGAVAFRRTE